MNNLINNIIKQIDYYFDYSSMLESKYNNQEVKLSPYKFRYNNFLKPKCFNCNIIIDDTNFIIGEYNFFKIYYQCTKCHNIIKLMPKYVLETLTNIFNNNINIKTINKIEFLRNCDFSYNDMIYCFSNDHTTKSIFMCKLRRIIELKNELNNSKL
jgi:hypothetical protein